MSLPTTTPTTSEIGFDAQLVFRHLCGGSTYGGMIRDTDPEKIAGAVDLPVARVAYALMELETAGLIEVDVDERDDRSD